MLGFFAERSGYSTLSGSQPPDNVRSDDTVVRTNSSNSQTGGKSGSQEVRYQCGWCNQVTKDASNLWYCDGCNGAGCIPCFEKHINRDGSCPACDLPFKPDRPSPERQWDVNTRPADTSSSAITYTTIPMQKQSCTCWEEHRGNILPSSTNIARNTKHSLNVDTYWEELQART